MFHQLAPPASPPPVQLLFFQDSPGADGASHSLSPACDCSSNSSPNYVPTLSAFCLSTLALSLWLMRTAYWLKDVFLHQHVCLTFLAFWLNQSWSNEGPNTFEQWQGSCGGSNENHTRSICSFMCLSLKGLPKGTTVPWWVLKAQPVRQKLPCQKWSRNICYPSPGIDRPGLFSTLSEKFLFAVDNSQSWET